MSKHNHLTKRGAQRAAHKRTVAISAAIVVALLISMILTMKAHAVGQLTITVSNTGMTPTSATVNGGIVHLKIENSSTREIITLRINRENGSLVREIVLPEGTRELSTEMEIGAGQFVLTDSSNTAWSCQLTVQ